MNREIKFRGKRIDNGEWAYGYLQDVHSVAEIGVVKLDLGDRLIIIEDCDPKTVGQYTGLKDNNGVEIYEGDILKDSELSYMVCYGKYWDDMLDDYCYGWYEKLLEDGTQFSFYHDKKQLKVIGNIHKNPESLN